MPTQDKPSQLNEPAARQKVSLVLHKFSRGGSDRVAAYLARGFVAAGMDVRLIVFARGGEVEGILSELVGTDIPIQYLGQAWGPRPLDLIRGMPKFVRALRAQAPDIVISTANNTSLVSAIGVRLAGIRNCKLFLKTTNPIATSRHTGLVRRLRLWSYRRIFRWTSAVWTLSAAESQEMRDEFPEFASLFHDVANPYVTPAMLAHPGGLSVRPTGKTVICIARLTAQKRLERLIDAFAHVKGPDTRLLILGEGEDRAALEQRVSDLGLQNRVSMPGYAADVVRALHEADLFVLPSDYEGLPAVVLESMAANCPVLVTDCFPGAREMVENADGCAIIESTDPENLAALIDRHLEQPRPQNLWQIAEHYSIANGIKSHVDALMRDGATRIDQQ